MNDRGCKAVGIDLGTTYSALAFVDAQNTPRIMCDGNGQAVMPSVVFFDHDEVIVGEMALSQAKVHADRAVQFIKAHMGETWRKTFNGQEHTPESISALILGQLIREAEPQLGEIKDAVITVPAYFTEKRRRSTEQAGQIAGLNVIGTLNEPMAAMLAYGLHHQAREDNVVVYDLGGGTFDVTVVRITPNSLEELATNGNRQLGGRDWDEALVDLVCEDFQKKFGNDPHEDAQVLQTLQIECEQAKRRLGRMAKAAVRFHAFGHDHAVEITRQQFEDLTAHLLQSTKLTTEIALEDARLSWKQVSRVVLVGGSTHMPVVRNMLKDMCGRPPDTGINPVTAVALGAAIYGQLLETGRGMKIKQSSLQDPSHPTPTPGSSPSGTGLPAASTPQPARPNAPIPLRATPVPQAVPLSPAPPPPPLGPTMPKVSFVTAHGVGVRVIAQQKWRNEVLIPKNTKVPCQATRRFLTAGRGGSTQDIAITITQGDTQEIDLAEKLGVGKIRGIPPNEPPGHPVDVTMEFDPQGRLHMSAKYVRTGQMMTMSVDVQGGLREEDVKTYRDFMEKSGFTRPFNQAEALAKLDQLAPLDEDDDEDELDVIKPL